MPLVTIILTNLKANKFVIQGLPSTYDGGYGIDLQATGLGATVSGHFEFDVFHSSHLPFTGSFTASLGASDSGEVSQLSMSLAFPPTPDGYMAASGNVTDSTVELHIDPSSMEFSDMSAFQTILNLDAVDSAIASSLDPTLSSTVQSLIDSAVSPALTRLIRTLNTKILAVVSNGPSPPLDPSLDTSTLVKWSDAGRVSSFISSANAFLNSHLDSGGCNGGSGLNGLIRSLTSPSGSVSVALPPSSNLTVDVPGLATLTLGVRRLNASGLDTLTNLTVLDPLGSYGFRNAVGVAGLNVTAGVYVDVKPSPGSELKGTGLREDFNLGLGLVDASLGLDVLAAVGREVGNLTAGQFLNGTCALTAVREVNVTSLPARVTLSDLFLRPVGAGAGNTLEADLDDLIDGFLSLFVGGYNDLVRDAVYGILQGPVRSMINGAIKSADVDPVCPEVREMNETLFELDGSDVINGASTYINGVVGPDGLNDLVSCLASGAAGAGKGTIHEFVLPSGLAIDVKDLALTSAPGSFYELDVIDPDPQDHYRLTNAVGLAECGKPHTYADGCHGLRGRVTVTASNPNTGSVDALNVSAALGDLLVSLGVRAEFDTARFLGLRVSQLGNAGCVGSSFKSFSLDGDDVSLGAFGAELHGYLSSAKGTKDVDAVFNSTRATSLVAAVAKGGLGMAKDYANEAAAYAVYVAPYVCAGDPVPAPPSPSPGGGAPPLWKSGIAMVAYGSLFVLGVFVWAQKYRGRTARNIGKSVDLGRSKSDELNYAFLEGGGDDEKQLTDRAGGSSLGEDIKAASFEVSGRGEGGNGQGGKDRDDII